MTGVVALVSLAVLCGVAVTLQSHFMGTMDQGLGTLESVFITYGSGGLAVGLAMLAARGGNLGAWRQVPWYALTAGLLGLVIVGTIGYTVPRLGLVAALTVIVVSQFTLAAVIDNFGWLGAEARPLDLSRVAGLLVLSLGTWLVLR